jgi:hypothetical protein
VAGISESSRQCHVLKDFSGHRGVAADRIVGCAMDEKVLSVRSYR